MPWLDEFDVFIHGYFNNQMEVDSIIDINATASAQFDALEEITSTQIGISFDVKYSLDKLTLRLYGSLQKTTYENSDWANTAEIEKQVDSLESLLPLKARVKIHAFSNPNRYNEKTTPQFYGSFVLDYTPTSKFGCNLNAYVMGKQVFLGYNLDSFGSDFTENYTGEHQTEIAPYINVNAQLYYKFLNYGKIYLSARNLLGKHKEYGYADNVNRLFLIGLSYNF